MRHRLALGAIMVCTLIAAAAAQPDPGENVLGLFFSDSVFSDATTDFENTFAP